MRIRRYFAPTLLILAVTLVSGLPVFAKNSQTVNMPVEGVLNGTHLPIGDYQVKWETHSPEATVTFLKKNKVVTTAQGKLVERDTKCARNTVVYQTNSDGTNTVLEIRFAGSNQVLIFNE